MSEPAIAPAVAFLGSDDVAAKCLALLHPRVPVALAVTQPPRRRSRRGGSEPTPLGAVAGELGVALLETRDVNDAEAVARIRACRPTLLVVVSFGQILRDETLALAPEGAVNLHFSLLPRWRGAAPVQRAILAADEWTGVSVQRMVRKLDAGPVLAERRLRITATDDTQTLRERLTEDGGPLLVQVTEAILRGERPPETQQDAALVTFAPRIEKREGIVDFAAEDAEQLARRVRAFGGWPGCRARLETRRGPVDLRLLSAEALPCSGPVPGQVLAVGPDGIDVGCRSGALRLLRVQKPGKRAVSVREFLHGCPVRPGDLFRRC